LALGKDWSLEVRAGVKFDDRVTVEEDDVSAASDVGFVFGLDAGYKLVNEEDTRIEIAYEFDQTLYSDLSALDYQVHTPSISAWTKSLGGVKLGIKYEFVHALLGGDDYLDQHIVSPSVTAMLSDDVQLTLMYRYYDKNYNPLDDERDGDTHQPTADLHYFFDKSKKGYLMVGGGYTDENTKGTTAPVTDPYDYSGFLGRAAVQVPIEPFGLPGRLRLSYNYQVRDYDDPTSTFPAVLPPPAGTPTRKDNRQTVRAYADVELDDGLSLYADYRFMDRGSNLPSADYNKNVVSVGLEYRF
jgi:predicted porin